MAAKWAVHKNELEQLYCNSDWKLGEIVDFMSKERGFKKSKPAYERKFKEWGCRRNRTSAQWRDISDVVESRAPSKGTDFYIGRDRIDLQDPRVRRKMARRAQRPEPSDSKTRTKIGEGMEVYALTPPVSSSSMVVFQKNLPWFQFNSLIESKASPSLDLAAATITAMTPLNTNIDVQNSTPLASDNASFAYLANILPLDVLSKPNPRDRVKKTYKHLQAILPDISGESPTWAHTGTGLIKIDSCVPQFSLLVYLVSNGFFDYKSPKYVLEYVELFLDMQSFRSVFQNKEPTIQALLERIFRASVESENIDMVQAALDSGANPNSKARSGETALVYAIEKRAKRIVQLLLEGGADINFKGQGGSVISNPCLSEVGAS
ncbi:hypothetical protein BP5796_12309 [Coleophoma crateriformis]|uniref:Clr5 domain-containing protein n=1 Tax=Coleophoma crateriformis TaxID=565419 RepID=A0A3D8Q9A8_9HELO|nr:hypothetical protein BP5796_12309 [Coleophoma crateriformis]